MPAEHRAKPAFLDIDFAQSPFIAIWEITRACDLRCVHCRAEAIPNRNPGELDWAQGTKMIDDIASFGDNPPLLVFTGGDPIKHPDLYKYIEYADQKGLRVAVTPSSTPLLNEESIGKMKEAGLTRMAISLDGSTAEIHDSFRKQPGSFDNTIRALKAAVAAGLTIQVNTTMSRWNINDIDNLCELMRSFGLTLWAVFFLVPTGRGTETDIISAEDHEVVFNKLYDLQMAGEFDIKTTAAPHYRRVVMQRQMEEGRAGQSSRYQIPDRRTETRDDAAPTLEQLQAGIESGKSAEEFAEEWKSREVMPGAWAKPDKIGRAGRGVNDGNGFVFIDHVGRVHPSGFMPYPAGSVKEESIVDIYRDSKVFKRVRDFKSLKGKCRMCEFRDVCGGARSRAFTVTGDPLASEPYCAYVPEKLRGEVGVDWLDAEMLTMEMDAYIETHGDI